MSQTIQLRRDTSANWTSVNPVLNQGEVGLETDTQKAKVGDGVTHWVSLPYWQQYGTSAPQNDVFAGPATGGAGAPSFRALAAADLPAATGAAQGAVQLAGDLGGTASSPQVGKVQGVAVTAPGTAGGLIANPMTAPGDTVYGGAAGVPARLAGNTSTTLEVFTSTGTGSAANAPAWQTPGTAGIAYATSGATASLVPSPEVNIVASRVIDRLNFFLGWLNSQGVSGAVTETAIPAPGQNFGSGTLTAADTLRWAEVAEAWFRTVDGYDMPVSAFPGAPNQAAYQAGQVVFSDAAAPVLRHVHGNFRGFQWGGVVGITPPGGYSNSNPITTANWYPASSVAAQYAGMGITMARVSFRWETLQPTLGGPLDPTELARITGAVNALGAAGIKCILDLHNYCSYITSATTLHIGDGTLTTANLTDVWTKLSTAFNGNTGVLAYEIMNEPSHLETYAGTYATTTSGTGTLIPGATIAVASTAAFPAGRAFGLSMPTSAGTSWFSAVVTNSTTFTVVDTAFGGQPTWAASAAVTSPQLAWEGISQAVVTAIRANADTTPVWVGGYYFQNAWLWPVNHPVKWITDSASATRYAAHHYWSASSSGDSFYMPWAQEYAASIQSPGGYGPLGGSPPVMGAAADRLPLQVGEMTAPRGTGTPVQMQTGLLMATLFRANRTETVNNVVLRVVGAASTSPTTAAVGIYRVNPGQNFLLLCQTNNLPGIWTAANTEYTRNFITPFYKQAGSLYAVALLVVQGSGTLATVAGNSNVVGASLWPWPCFRLAGQSALPSFFLNSAVTAGNELLCMALTP